MITGSQIQEFSQNGAVLLKNAFASKWLSLLAEGIEKNRKDPGPYACQYTPADKEGNFYDDYCNWNRFDEYRDFLFNSPAAEIAARLMRQDEVRFFYDQLFIKEPGTLAPTQWHNDIPFWPVDGNHIGSVWMALTPVTTETSGLVYVKGSHKWNKLFKAITPDEDPAFMDDTLERCPDFHKEFDNPEYEFLSWDMEPGDVIVHHPLAVHGTGKNASNTQRRVALSCRFYGGDTVWHSERVTGFKVPGAEESGVTSGVMPTDDTVFPVCWKAA